MSILKTRVTDTPPSGADGVTVLARPLTNTEVDENFLSLGQSLDGHIASLAAHDALDLTYNATTVKAALDDLYATKLNKAGGTMTGGITWSSSTTRLTFAYGTAFQAAETNGATYVQALPSGSNAVALYQAVGDSASANGVVAQFGVNHIAAGVAGINATHLGAATNPDFVIAFGGVEGARFTKSGRFGVGSNPDAFGVLSAVQSTVAGGAVGPWFGNSTAAAAGNRVRVGLGPSAGFVGSPGLAPYLESGTEDVANNAYVAVGTYNSTIGLAERFRITSSGAREYASYSGHDTVPALTTARVEGEAWSYRAGANDYGFLRLSAGGGASLAQKAAIDIQGYGSTDGSQIRFYTGGAERMRIASDGNIGIGFDPSGFPSNWCLLGLKADDVGGISVLRQMNYAADVVTDLYTANDGFHINQNGYGLIQFQINNSASVGSFDAWGFKTIITCETHQNVTFGATTTLDVSTGSSFATTASGSGAATIAITNTPPSGYNCTLTLELTNGGLRTWTYPPGTTWAGGVKPTLTVSGTDILQFFTRNGGVTWRGFLVSKDTK